MTNHLLQGGAQRDHDFASDAELPSVRDRGGEMCRMYSRILGTSIAGIIFFSTYFLLDCRCPDVADIPPKAFGGIC